MKFYIADAFTEKLFGGNPAGVVILDGCKGAPSNVNLAESGWPAEEIMIKTAAELRYSETAFVMPLGNGKFHTRYFTPAAEVDLCGHATIATFTVLREAGLIGEGDYINHTMAGDLTIKVSKTSVLMEMGAPKIGGELKEDAELRRLYEIMGLGDYAVHIKAGGFAKTLADAVTYPKMVSTGLMDIMMPVADREALEKISPDFAALTQLSKDYGVVGVHAFCPASPDELEADAAKGLTAFSGGVTAHARNFAPLYDIDEEAATGTSNGALTYYLKSCGILGESGDVCVIQGEKMGRPSVIRARLDGESVMVGGSAVILAEGNINL